MNEDSNFHSRLSQWGINSPFTGDEASGCTALTAAGFSHMRPHWIVDDRTHSLFVANDAFQANIENQRRLTLRSAQAAERVLQGRAGTLADQLAFGVNSVDTTRTPHNDFAQFHGSLGPAANSVRAYQEPRQLIRKIHQ